MSPEEAAYRLAKIQDVLNTFNWDWDDRQLALEKIERIAFGDEG